MATIDQRHRRAPLLHFLIIALVAAVAVFPPVAAFAADPDLPDFTGQFCKDLYDIPDDASRPDSDPLPGDEKTPPAGPKTYDFVNPARKWENLDDPYPEIPAGEISKQTAQDVLDLVDEFGATTNGTTSGTEEHIRAARRRYMLEKVDGTAKYNNHKIQGWKAWRNGYIPNQGNDAKGKAYMKWFAKRYKLGGKWLCEAEIDIAECKGIPFDIVNNELKFISELKSGTKPEDEQLARHKECLKKLKEKGWRMRYYFGRKAGATALRKVTITGLDMSGKQMPATAVEKLTAAPAAAPAVGVAPQGANGGSVDTTLAGAPANSEEAKEADATNESEAQHAAVDNAAKNRQTPAQALAGAMENADVRPGGIDFTSLELRYMSVSGDDVRYSFSAAEAPDNVHSFGGLSKAQLSSDALFTWLALPESSFWVNLNPDTPDQIAGEQLAGTDVGRVLLTSDLLLKHWSSKLLNPAAKAGDRYWDATHFDRFENFACSPIRLWISPGVASVREDGDQLYVLDAPLVANVENFVVKNLPKGLKCKNTPAKIEESVAAYRRIILPELTRTVNTDPGFADLRRVYQSLVIAKWLRERSAAEPNAYTPIIDSGDASRWPARTKWDQQKVYQDFLKSWYNGDATYSRKVLYKGRRVPVTWTMGGVDFTAGVQETKVTAEEFAQKYAQLPDTVSDSRAAPVTDVTTGELWLGGGNVAEQRQPAAAPSVTTTPAPGSSTTAVVAASSADLPFYRGTRFLLSALAVLMVVGITYRRVHHRRRRRARFRI